MPVNKATSEKDTKVPVLETGSSTCLGFSAVTFTTFYLQRYRIFMYQMFKRTTETCFLGLDTLLRKVFWQTNL